MSDRRDRVLAAVRAPADTSPTARLCSGAVELLSVTGVGISLMAADNEHRGTVCATEGARQAEDLQFSLGEGPCMDAHRSGGLVLAPDISAVTTWPVFGPAALDAGIAAGFAFPLQVGAIRFGTLNLYRAAPGELTGDQFSDALVLADIARNMVLALQAQAPSDELHDLLADDAGTRWEVHQATGMLATQLAIGLQEALVRLRAHAYVTGVSLHAVAADVVGRRLRLESWS